MTSTPADRSLSEGEIIILATGANSSLQVAGACSALNLIEALLIQTTFFRRCGGVCAVVKLCRGQAGKLHTQDSTDRALN